MSMAMGITMAMGMTITTMGKGSNGATHSGHLSPRPGRGRLASGALAKRSKSGEGVRAKVESPVPPHPDPERERAGASASAALYRLLAWLSPSYPVGAFSYSGGLEWAVEAGDVRDADTLRRWLEVVMGQGGGFCDAVLLVHAHAAATAGDAEKLKAVAELAAAMTPSRERHLETTAQGRAFVDTTRAAWPCAALEKFLAVCDGPIAYPVAVGVAAAGHGIAVAPCVAAYLQAIAANLVSAGVRLIPLGQTAGQRVLAALEDTIAAAAERALATPLGEVGGAAFRADLAGMRHETQYTRLFRS